MNATPITQARIVAHAAHAAINQMYGDKPYIYHLAEVVSILNKAGFRDDTTIQVGYLHDVLEDTGVTPEVLEDTGFHPDVVRGVMFCTDEDGPNRKTRKANTYKKVRQDIDAHPDEPWLLAGLATKWADRIANLRASTKGNPGLLKMYRKERQAFRDAYLPPRLNPQKWSALVDEYDHLVGT